MCWKNWSNVLKNLIKCAEKSDQMYSAQRLLPPPSLYPLKSHSGVLIQGSFVIPDLLFILVDLFSLQSHSKYFQYHHHNHFCRWVFFSTHNTWNNWQRGRKVIMWRDISFSWEERNFDSECQLEASCDQRHQSGKKIPSKVFVQYHQKLPSKDEQTLISEILTLLMSLQSLQSWAALSNLWGITGTLGWN